jgi:hypothetical protein
MIPLSGLPLLTYKLRTGGIAWLRQRLLEEYQLPRTRAGQALFRAGRAMRRATIGPSREDPQAAEATGLLYAFYDLAVAPISFDFLWFLVGAELERQRRGSASLHVVIVPGPHAGVRKEQADLEQILDPAARKARVNTMLVPACTFLPSVTGITLVGSRSEAEQLVILGRGNVFPPHYEPAYPSYPGPHEPLRAAREEGARVGVLRATTADLRTVDDWLAARGCGSRVVTITLRGYDYVPARNSNIDAWVGLARRLDPARFFVVFVPDTAQCFKGLPAALRDFPVFIEAAMVLGLRMALYQRAYLNLGVNNGPMGLCWLNDQTRYITFKILSEAAPQTTPEYMKFLGFELGKSLPFATPWQQWVWREDEIEVIDEAFNAMLERLDESSCAGELMCDVTPNLQREVV